VGTSSVRPSWGFLPCSPSEPLSASPASRGSLSASQIAQDAVGPDRVHMEGNGGGGGGSSPSMETRPSGSPDPNATPGGRVTPIDKSADATTVRSITRENESAEILAKNGYKVEQNPKVPGDKNPDYRVEGEIMDCYAPTTDKPRAISHKIQEKVDEGQADRIVLNMSDTPVDMDAMRKQLNDWPINGLKEVKVIDKAGNILHLYP
ncbi:CdiA C-terminal domain-containing protein, partial [Kitasatospora sp. NPDC001159]